MAHSYNAGDEPVPGYRLTERLELGCFGQAWKAFSGDGSNAVVRIFPLKPEQVALRMSILDELPQIAHPSLVGYREVWVRDKQGKLHNELAASAKAPSRTSGGTVMLEPDQTPVFDAVECLMVFEAPTRGILQRWQECQQQGQSGIPSEELLAYFTSLAGGIDLLQATDCGPHGLVDPRSIQLWGSQARLCDWGIRALLADNAGTERGPTIFMPPERLNSGTIRGRADQYALAMCYAKLRSNRMQLDTLDDGAVLDLAGLTASERQVIQRATALAPGDRYESCEEFVRALRAAGGGETVTASAVRTVVIPNQPDADPDAALVPDSNPPKQPAAQTIMITPDETPEKPESPQANEPESPQPKRAQQTVMMSANDIPDAPQDEERLDAPPPAPPKSPASSANTVMIPPGDNERSEPLTDVPLNKGSAPPTVYIGPDAGQKLEEAAEKRGQQTVVMQPGGGQASKPGKAPPTVHEKIDKGAKTVNVPSPTIRENVEKSSGTVSDVRDLVTPADDDGDVGDDEFMGAAEHPSADAEGVIGDYLLIEKLGDGGTGTVYRAMHRHMERIVAVKVLAERTLADPGAAERFAREAELAARLSHENIVTAYNADQDGERHYLVMEYVDGKTLFDVVYDDGPVSAAQAVEYVVQAAKGLEYAHGQSIVHRDIKPGNLMVDQQGTVKILDMGLARFYQASADSDHRPSITASGTLMGTVDFMSPEQAKSPKYADHRADIYSLGCTLHFMLTGEPPFPAKTLVDSVVAHRERPIPALPGVSSALQEVFERTMAKLPEERFQTMSEMIDALENVQLEASDATQARPAGPQTVTSAAQPTVLTQQGEATAPQPAAPPANPLVWKIIAGVAVLIALALILQRLLGG